MQQYTLYNHVADKSARQSLADVQFASTEEPDEEGPRAIQASHESLLCVRNAMCVPCVYAVGCTVQLVGKLPAPCVLGAMPRCSCHGIFTQVRHNDFTSALSLSALIDFESLVWPNGALGVP